MPPVRQNPLVTIGSLLLAVFFFMGMGMIIGHEPSANHRESISWEKAIEIIRTSKDESLRAGARFALDDHLRLALDALRVDDGSKQLLAAWATLLR